MAWKRVKSIPFARRLDRLRTCDDRSVPDCAQSRNYRVSACLVALAVVVCTPVQAQLCEDGGREAVEALLVRVDRLTTSLEQVNEVLAQTQTKLHERYLQTGSASSLTEADKLKAQIEQNKRSLGELADERTRLVETVDGCEAASGGDQ